jgi:hypothetical protein
MPMSQPLGGQVRPRPGLTLRWRGRAEARPLLTTGGDDDMAFVQIIEFRTDDIEAMRAAEQDWERDTAGKRTARRLMLTQDRDDPSRYHSIVFIDYYQ